MKKITILALHLGYGGIERALISLANMLSLKYEVEILSTYQVLEKPAFSISSNITIKYLLPHQKPNKKEFDEAANDHQEQIIQEFEKDGYILACYDLDTLDKVLKKAKRFHPKKYVSHTRKFVNQLNHYISTGEI